MTVLTVAPARRLPRARLRRIASLGLYRGQLELLQFFRGTETVVFSLLFPVFALVIFSSMFDGEIAPGVTYSDYLVPGIIATGLMVTGFQTLAISIAIERDRGGLKRIAATPMPRSAYFIGKVIMVLVTSVVETVVLVAVSVVLYGTHLPGTADAWLTFGWVSLLGVTACALCGIALSSLPRNSRSAPAVVAPFAFVLQFISGAALVFTDLPPWLQWIASAFPLKWMCQGLRSVFLPDSYAAQEAAHSWQLGWVAVALIAWVILGTVLCLATFRWTKTRDGG
ncbi:ABC transporter permease [Dactylosporangium siamense]|uniref:Transport permease protein n=1 Tax=Dactylosporangium siamense TaxID=685454 RepID=A0A919Q1M6_9ACTN|nr:ABC transporter permease [Dactylosporangium siamense]GIG52593.1 transport permease protein [Dactylosporangium siamense]